MYHKKPQVALIGYWFFRLFGFGHWHTIEDMYDSDEQYWCMIVRDK